MRAWTLFLIIILFSASNALSQSIVGKWKTIDDATGEVKSVVQIFESGGKYYGKIIQLFRGPDEDQDPVCGECSGAKKDKKIIGMQIIEDMSKGDDGNYVDGEILDPENGRTYGCKMWLEEGKLKVRGYLLFLYRTQTWEPYDG